jgi:sugar phosphate isomerase/epimerase
VKSGWWKAIGLAGAAGVVATGVVAARRERERRAYTPEEIRDRLQDRYADMGEEARREATEAWKSRRQS